ncbi:beta-ketoacyl-[acyl-carrier-protein] synthase family protein [Phragmitibacter flavus]|uniref:beta-ketoacyl-[acyl-carrier-protein] synthase family protein n=1 Tax=Phragmitibacter flavus TaxID=2576071 RepID=UPI001F1047B9|nr:beta-ketoacyl-[acyl-carrier-protein] synthase family protein [Phragmitibacter flavus]
MNLDPHRRAVITGLGPVTPIGIGKSAFWSGLLAEKSAISRLTRFESPHTKARHAAEIRDFDPSLWFAPHQTKRWDRCTTLAMVAAQLAIEDSGLDLSKTNPTRTAISFGSALGGIADAEHQHHLFLENGPKSVSRALALQIYGGSTHGNLSIHFNTQGPATTHSNSCASGNVAIADALRLIRQGAADIVIAGASESPLSPLTYAAFDQIHTMSRWQGDPPAHACRPFDTQRDGFVMGEGAAIIIVESLSHARARNARIYAELTGSSLICEAHHMTIPKPDGTPLRRAMQLALDDARLNPGDMSYINAHASSTPQNDLNEATAIATLFGEKSAPPVSGTKAYTGHSLGAIGAVEALICALAIENQWLPPTLHFESTDCPITLDYLPNHGRETKVTAVLNNSFGFGGIDSCLILQKTT